MFYSSTELSEIREMLAKAAAAGHHIRVTQCFCGEREVKTYRFKTGFPFGPKRRSVPAWYSLNFQNDQLFNSTADFSRYIYNITHGHGGHNISYMVEEIAPEIEHAHETTSHEKRSHPSSMAASPKTDNLIKTALQYSFEQTKPPENWEDRMPSLETVRNIAAKKSAAQPMQGKIKPALHDTGIEH